MRTWEALAAVVSVILLGGCAATIDKATQEFQVPAGKLVMVHDLSEMQSLCNSVLGWEGVDVNGFKIGCYNQMTRTMYCTWGMLSVCGHELMHYIGLQHGEF